MRLRTRLVAGFLAAHLALSLLLAAGAWWWLDRERRHAAAASAEAVGQVLARGGFSATPEVLARMRTLTGYDFRLLDPGEVAGPDTVSVQAQGRTIAIAYRTEAYRQAEADLWWAVLAWTAAGTAAFAAVAVWQARRLARPVEDLAEAARRLGAGAWEAPVPSVGEGEVAVLAREVEALRRRLVELIAAGRTAERLATLGGFTATIAHEVRNPLSAVRLTVQAFAVRLGDDPGLRLVQEELERLDLIVDELLAFSRGFPVRPAPGDVAEEARQVVRLLARQAAHLGVSLTVEGVSSSPCLVDRQRLRQLLLNLVLNALQAASQGEAEVPAVRMVLAVDGLQVIDNGPGVPVERVDRLFQAFASDRPEGTGLGLHLAAAIANAHGAHLTYAPAMGGGACFTLAGLRPAADLRPL